MASRGGRGCGFGRRGGGSGGGSNTRALLARAALEAGIDDRTHLTLEAITHPPLYPDLIWHSSGRQGHHHWATNPFAVPSSSSLSSAADPSSLPIAITSSAAPTAALESTTSLTLPTPPTPALSNPKRPAHVVNLINKHREMLQAFAESAQHLNVSTTSDSVVDVPRWQPDHDNDDEAANATTNPNAARQKPDVHVLSTLGKLGTDPKYFPAELLPSHDPPPRPRQASRKNQKRKLTNTSSGWRRDSATKSTRWEELAQRETNTGVDGAGAATEEEDVATGTHANKAGKGTDAEEREEDDDDDDAADELPAEEEEEDLEDYTKDYYESEGESDGGDGEATF